MKKNIIFVIIIVLLLGIIGFGGYKYINLQKDNDKLSDENKTITEELREAEKTAATNDYSLFVKQMKETREKLNTTSNNWKSTTRFTERHNYGVDGQNYTINLEADGVLVVDTKEISKNVLFYVTSFTGNGGLIGIFFVTEDGKAHVADVEEAFRNNKEITVSEIKGTANVVNILPAMVEDSKNEGAVSNPTVLFVDINGNIQKGSID